MNPKLTVIVPVYKVEQYIEKCARSLFEQTLEGIEYLFIDDCSPDNSIDVLKRTVDEYPHRKSQVMIISMPNNSGQSEARRIGMMKAKGDFMIHCDSDDWVDRDLYEKMYNEAMRTSADMVICNVIKEYGFRRINSDYNYFPETGKELLKNLPYYCFSMYMCNKMVKSSLIKEYGLYSYEDVNMWEDNGMMYRILYYSNRLVFVEDSYYHYRKTNLSATTHYYGEEAVRQMILCAQKLTDFFQSQIDYNEFQTTVAHVQYHAKINLIRSDFSDIKKYRKTFPQVTSLPKGYDKNAFSKQGLIRYIMVQHHLTFVFIFLFKMFNCYNKLVNHAK